MSSVTHTSTAAEIVTVHEAELHAPQRAGGQLRAYCPVHGGDHQRSLSIALDGERAGYGYCHSCQARVFVPELNPDAAARREHWQERGPVPPRRITGRDLLRPARRPTPAAAPTDSVPEWQRAEVATLCRLAERMRSRLADDRAQAYLAEREIPPTIAAECGVGYIPADTPIEWRVVERDHSSKRVLFIAGTELSAKWRDRLVFPLGSPDGRGFIGRSLHGWRPGMDEDAHKALLEAKDRAADDVTTWGRRWEKTNPAGWYGWDDLHASGADHVVIVEGSFDALALVAAGLPLGRVVALGGTAARVRWLPPRVASVVLGLDGDGTGRAKADTLRRELREVGVKASTCTPPAADGRGKDWSARWRCATWNGTQPIFDALDDLTTP